MTYGDGLSDIDISPLIRFHQGHGRLVTATAVSPPGRFGVVDRDGDQVIGSTEKPLGE